MVNHRPRNIEFTLRDYLSEGNGANLYRVDPQLRFVSKEYPYDGGRLDILAYKIAHGRKVPVGLELKANQFGTRSAARQMDRHMDYLGRDGGILYFLSTYVPQEFLRYFRQPFEEGRLVFYDVHANTDYTSFTFNRLRGSDITRPSFNPIRDITKGLIYRLPDAAGSAGRNVARSIGRGNIAQSVLASVFRGAAHSIKGTLLDLVDNRRKRRL